MMTADIKHVVEIHTQAEIDAEAAIILAKWPNFPARLLWSEAYNRLSTRKLLGEDPDDYTDLIARFL